MLVSGPRAQPSGDWRVGLEGHRLECIRIEINKSNRHDVELRALNDELADEWK